LIKIKRIILETDTKNDYIFISGIFLNGAPSFAWGWDNFFDNIL